MERLSQVTAGMPQADIKASKPTVAGKQDGGWITDTFRPSEQIWSSSSSWRSVQQQESPKLKEPHLVQHGPKESYPVISYHSEKAQIMCDLRDNVRDFKRLEMKV